MTRRHSLPKAGEAERLRGRWLRSTGDGSKPTRIGFRRTLVSRGTDGLIINVQPNRRPSGQRPRRGDGHMRVAQAKWARLSGADLSGIRNKQDLIMRVQERYSLP